MMYLALSYDHRIIDGNQSVGFLIAVKEGVEDPENILMDGKVEKSLGLNWFDWYTYSFILRSF